MNKLTAFLKQLRLGKLLAVILAGFVLLTTTACNPPVNQAGARPNNTPVQMGGSNNPHKKGGDGYTEYNQNKRASLMSGQLVASAPGTGVQYRGSDDEGKFGAGQDQSEVNKKFVKDATKIPADPQYVIDRSNPDERILEKTGQAFKEATSFIKDSGAEAVDRPAVQPNENQPHANR